MLGPLGLYCSSCDPGLPAWQEAVLGSIAVAIAFGILFLLFRLPPFRRRLRNIRLRACFLAVQRAWSKEDPAWLASFVTLELGDQLRRQLAGIAASGRVIHHQRPRVRRLRVISGDGGDDGECIARIESSVRHWLTDARTGELVGGSREVSRDEALWRFVRDPATDWLAAEIGVAEPPSAESP